MREGVSREGREGSGDGREWGKRGWEKWEKEGGRGSGLALVVVTVVFEIPIFNHSDWILKHINVHFLVVIAAVSYIVRVVCYTLFSNPWRKDEVESKRGGIGGESKDEESLRRRVRLMFVLFVEPLHGVTYACAQLAGVHYAAELGNGGKMEPMKSYMMIQIVVMIMIEKMMMEMMMMEMMINTMMIEM
eukprot:756461-Hanusia_phi.AAC.7